MQSKNVKSPPNRMEHARVVAIPEFTSDRMKMLSPIVTPRALELALGRILRPKERLVEADGDTGKRGDPDDSACVLERHAAGRRSPGRRDDGRKGDRLALDARIGRRRWRSWRARLRTTRAGHCEGFAGN